MLALLALLALGATAQPCSCSLPIQKTKNKGVVSYLVVGDWGRYGGNLSTTPASQGGYDQTGWCSDPKNGFVSDDFDGKSMKMLSNKILCDHCPRLADDSFQYRNGAAMDKACAMHPTGCDLVISTGDNFYGACVGC